MSTANPVQADTAVGVEGEYVSTTGLRIKVRSLPTGGALKLIGAIARADIGTLPPSLTEWDFASANPFRSARRDLMAKARGLRLAMGAQDEAAGMATEKELAAIEHALVMLGQEAEAGLTAGERDRLQQAMVERIKAALRWAVTLEEVAPVFLEAVTDKPREELLDLPLADTMRVIQRAMECLDLPGLVTCVFDFFTQFGGLMAEVGKQKGRLAQDGGGQST